MDKYRWQKIEQLFQAAMELSAAEREAFLNKECEDDAVLRKEVESLLDNVRENTNINAAVQQAADSLLGNEQDPGGTNIGSYRILRLLGQGGMGAVYLAERADDQYHKQVAIKLIRSGHGSEETLRRFRVERQILATLEHPYIARLLDGGTTDDGQPYLVMEYVQGEAVDQYCQRNQLNLTSRLQLFRKICSAVQYAHQKLVIHRDLKPGNILITEDGEPRLLDFGIAKLVDKSRIDQTLYETRAEVRLLTPFYSSPEQVRGQPVSTVTDVYALGIILYELITGRRPFPLSGNSRHEMERAVLNSEPVRPSASFTTGGLDTVIRHWDSGEQIPALRKRLRGDIDNIVLKALRKEPERRYYSVAQFSEDLGNFLEHKPVLAHADSWAYRSGKFLQRHRWSSALGALLVLSILGFSVSSWIQSQIVAKERDIARAEAAKAEAVSDFLTRMLRSVDPANAQGNEVTVREVLDRANQELASPDHAFKRAPMVEARVRRAVGNTYLELGLIDPARQSLEHAVALHHGQHIPDPAEYTLALIDLSSVFHHLFLQDRRIALNEEALELSKRVFGPDHRHTLGIMNNLASAHHMNGDLEEAQRLFLQVYRLRQARYGVENLDTIASLESLASGAQWLGDYQQAINYSRQCVAHSRKLVGEKHPQTLRCLQALGSILDSNGDFTTAGRVTRQHLDLAREVLGENHPDTLRSMHNLADIQRALGEFSEAESLFRRTLQQREDVLGDIHIETLQTRMKLALLLQETGRVDAAQPLAVNAYENMLDQLGIEHPGTLAAAHILLGIYKASGNSRAALDLQRQIHNASGNMQATQP